MTESAPTVNFPALERISRRALRRHALTERERLVAEIVLDFSYALEQPAARIPRQDIFVTLTGISKGNVSSTLAALEAARVLHIDRAGGLYTFLPDASTWRVRSRLATAAHVAAADRTEAWLAEAARTAADQLFLLEPLPDLTLLLAADARESMGYLDHSAQPGREYQCADSRASEPNHGRESRGSSTRAEVACSHGGDHQHAATAPEDGGDVADFRDLQDLRRRIAESLDESHFAGGGESPPEVPESGTSSRYSGNSPLNVNAVNVISKKSQLNVPFTGVPKSGTDGGTERELLDALRKACGEEAMRLWGGKWRMRIREDAPAVREALGDLKLHMVSGRKIKKSPGHFLTDRYRRIRAEWASATKKPK